MVVHLVNAVQRVKADDVGVPVIVNNHVHLSDTGNFVIDLDAVQMFGGKVVPVVKVINCVLITEAEALKICYDRGYDWSGLYEIYHRCSCWCCPLQRINELRKLRHHHPELWKRLRDMDQRARNLKLQHEPIYETKRYSVVVTSFLNIASKEELQTF